MKQSRIYKFFYFLCILTVFLSGCTSNNSYQKTDFIMGTSFSQTLYTDSSHKIPELKTTADQVNQLLRDLEQSILSWRYPDSEVGKINQGNTELSKQCYSYLLQAQELYQMSTGAFHPAMGELLHIWDIDGTNPSIPSNDQINEKITLLTKATPYSLSATPNYSITLSSGTTLDLGAIGKGIGCDEAIKAIQSSPTVTGAIVALGGSIAIYGEKGPDTAWEIAITHPRQENGNAYLGTLSLSVNTQESKYISTSGDYEKFFIKDKTRYHHILDPSTGYPANSNLISVTVVCNSGLLADGLSTACFILGEEKSIPLLSYYDAEAIFVDANQNITTTEGLSKIFHPSSLSNE